MDVELEEATDEETTENHEEAEGQLEGGGGDEGMTGPAQPEVEAGAMDEAASQTEEEANVVEAEGPPEKADGADESRDGATPKQVLEATEEKKAPQIQHSATG